MPIADLLSGGAHQLFFWLLMRGHVCPECPGVLRRVTNPGGEHLLVCRACEKLWARRGKQLEAYEQTGRAEAMPAAHH